MSKRVSDEIEQFVINLYNSNFKVGEIAVNTEYIEQQFKEFCYEMVLSCEKVRLIIFIIPSSLTNTRQKVAIGQGLLQPMVMSGLIGIVLLFTCLLKIMSIWKSWHL